MPRLFGRNFTRRQLLNRVGDKHGADLIDVFNASGLGFSA